MADRPAIDQAGTEALCRSIGETLAAVCPPGIGFALVVFTLDPGWSAYCSNAQSADMVRELRDIADRLEGRRSARHTSEPG